MPRKVDVEHSEKQKADIAAAVWRLAARAGLESVSVREVAAEAGVSNGRVQYYFPNKEAMLLYGLQLAQPRREGRVRRRLARLPGPVDGEGILRAVLDEMLGDDPDTRQAIRVSLAYHGRALEDPYVAELLTGDDAELRAQAAGVDVTLSVVEGQQHVFPFNAGRTAAADDQIAAIAKWYAG